MASLAKLEGMKSLLAKLKARRRDARRDNDASVAVGYTAEYAIYVHEDMKARHRAGQKAKYLEDPARRMSNDGTLAGIVQTAVRRGVPLLQALYLAGLRLQRESQKEVPVDTGNLRGSAFTRKE